MQNSELILTSAGALYHLGVKPGELATKIIFVGDQDRVGKVSQFFEKVEFTQQNREFVTHTGWFRDQRISVISTGIGTDNIDIVWNEIDAIFNMDLVHRTPLSTFTPVKALRLGTCGGMQPDIPVGTIVNSQFAIGSDGLLSFYDDSSLRTPTVKELESAWDVFQQKENLNFPTYITQGSSSLFHLLAKEQPLVQNGITFTATGFYGPQGRGWGRVPIRYPRLPEQIAKFKSLSGLRILNMEMETAGILGLAKALGHAAGSLSVIIANRQKGVFSADPQAAVAHLIQRGLEIMVKWE